jgi:hypothetical protein
MDYLTKYYKNLSESLQERLNHLEQILSEDVGIGPGGYGDQTENPRNPNIAHQMLNPDVSPAMQDFNPDRPTKVRELTSDEIRRKLDKLIYQREITDAEQDEIGKLYDQYDLARYKEAQDSINPKDRLMNNIGAKNILDFVKT